MRNFGIKFATLVGFSAFAVSEVFGATYVPPKEATSKINSYKGYSELTKAAGDMDIDQYTYNMTTWQISNGGFYKAMASSYVSPYTGGEKSEWRAVGNQDLGTIDNNATIQEMRLLAIRYKETTNSNYKNTFKSSFKKAVQFLLDMQRSTGGLPQVWPQRGNYSDYVTLNDNAMIRAMVTMKDIADKVSPFDSDIIDDATRVKMQSAVERAVDFLLKAQIVNNGNLTVWCAQHDAVTYEPRGARAYELPSKSGNESMGVVWFLMNWPDQNEKIQAAVKGAIAWYKKNKLKDKDFSKTAGVVDKEGSSLWFRFYEVDRDDYFFCDRGGESTKTQNFMAISEERRKGYQWAGDYGSAILAAEKPYLEALAKMDDNYVPPPPTPVIIMCGSDTCKTAIDGINFVKIKGAEEATHVGFAGDGYANVDNEKGSFVTYGVTALKEGNYTLYISYANGKTGARDFSITSGETVLVENASMGETGAWTNYETMAVDVELPAGYSELTFTSLGSEGMANIDAIGWMSSDLKIGKVEIEPENPGADTTTLVNRRINTKRYNYKAFSGNYGKGAGIFYILNDKKVVRVNGRK